MQVKLSNKVFCIFGFRGSGKSILGHYIATNYGEKCLLYDTLNECSPNTKYHTYAPKDRYNEFELQAVVRAIMTNPIYRLFIIDEANRYCLPKPARLPQAVADLNDWCRHAPYKLGVGFIARRPVQLSQDITELADYLFIFRLGGKSDIKYLNDLSDNLGDTVRLLRPFHFCIVYPDRSYRIARPVFLDKRTET